MFLGCHTITLSFQRTNTSPDVLLFDIDTFQCRCAAVHFSTRPPVESVLRIFCLARSLMTTFLRGIGLEVTTHMRSSCSICVPFCIRSFARTLAMADRRASTSSSSSDDTHCAAPRAPDMVNIAKSLTSQSKTGAKRPTGCADFKTADIGSTVLNRHGGQEPSVQVREASFIRYTKQSTHCASCKTADMVNTSCKSADMTENSHGHSRRMTFLPYTVNCNATMRQIVN